MAETAWIGFAAWSGSSSSVGRSRQVDLRARSVSSYRATGRRAGQAVLEHGPGPAASRRVGQGAGAARCRWTVDPRRGPRPVRRPGTPIAQGRHGSHPRPVADSVRVARGAAFPGRRRLLVVGADLALAQPRHHPRCGRRARPADAPQRAAQPGGRAPLPHRRLSEHLVTRAAPQRGTLTRTPSDAAAKVSWPGPAVLP